MVWPYHVNDLGCLVIRLGPYVSHIPVASAPLVVTITNATLIGAKAMLGTNLMAKAR